jgi:hypothetical protein
MIQKRSLVSLDCDNNPVPKSTKFKAAKPAVYKIVALQNGCHKFASLIDNIR